MTLFIIWLVGFGVFFSACAVGLHYNYNTGVYATEEAYLDDCFMVNVAVVVWPLTLIIAIAVGLAVLLSRFDK